MEEKKTFSEIIKDAKILKKIKKHGMSIGITFNKEEQKLYDLEYDDTIDLSSAVVLKNKGE